MSEGPDDTAPGPQPAAVTVVPFPSAAQRRRWWVLRRPAPGLVVPPPAPGFLSPEDLDDPEHVDTAGDVDAPVAPVDRAAAVASAPSTSRPVPTPSRGDVVRPAPLPPRRSSVGSPLGPRLTLSAAAPVEDVPVVPLPTRSAATAQPRVPSGAGGVVGPSLGAFPVGPRPVTSGTPSRVARPDGGEPAGVGAAAEASLVGGGTATGAPRTPAPRTPSSTPDPGPAVPSRPGAPRPAPAPQPGPSPRRGPVVPGPRPGTDVAAGPEARAAGTATVLTSSPPQPLSLERRSPARVDPATRAVEMLAAELAATRGLLAEMFAHQRSETVLLREEVSRLREEVQCRPLNPLLGVTRAVLQAHNDDLAERAVRLGGAASAAFTLTAQQVGLDDDGLLALQEWVGGGGRGVVVTPDERQRLLLGVAALHHVVEQGRPVVVVAPRRQDVLDWSTTLRELLPATPVVTGRHRADDVPGEGRVLVTTAHAYARDEVRRGPAAGLLVAVDVERFGAPSLATALDARVDWRLGLSGAYRRTDDGLVRHTDPYFDGGVVRVG